jgi:hypothetical protein
MPARADGAQVPTVAVVGSAGGIFALEVVLASLPRERRRYRSGENRRCRGP